MQDSITSFLRPSTLAATNVASWFGGSVLSDTNLAIGVACLFALGALIRAVRRPRNDQRPARLWLLGLFILTGVAAQVLSLVSVLWPEHRPASAVMVAVLLVSLVCAAALIPGIPKMYSGRSSTELQHEIVQRRKTELELRHIHVQLEGIIEQRTSELAAKTEEMEQFLNTVSHDLKNPIVNFMGLLRILREDLAAGRLDATVDSVDRMERSVARMRQLIDDLLNLSRLGRVRFDLTEVDTGEMIRSIVDELGPRLRDAGIALKIEDDLPRVTADARWLTEVFENLITNAMKYGCDQPQPRIVVGSAVAENQTRIFVRDNGQGIDPAHHAQIFEPFRRLRSDKEGSGMGLAIVVRILKMHGGRVWIESEPGHGATFWVALPGPPKSATAQEMMHSLTGA